MTTATQAQIIEALNIGKAACLIACALEPIRDNWKKWENAADIIERQAAALAAAAEAVDSTAVHTELMLQTVAATIEHCAQVADKWLAYGVAEDIRALKGGAK